MERKLLHQRMIDIWSPYLKCQGILVVACLQCSDKGCQSKKTQAIHPRKLANDNHKKLTMNEDVSVSPTKHRLTQPFRTMK